MSYFSANTNSVSKSEEINDQENPTLETPVDLGIFYSNHLEVVPATANKYFKRLGIVGNNFLSTILVNT